MISGIATNSVFNQLYLTDFVASNFDCKYGGCTGGFGGYEGCRGGYGGYGVDHNSQAINFGKIDSDADSVASNFDCKF